MTEEISFGYEEYFASSLSASASFQHPDSSINSAFYLCPICQMIARNPIEVPCCHHWYCASCFLTYIEQSAARNYSPFVVGSFKCAICRGIFNAKIPEIAQVYTGPYNITIYMFYVHLIVDSMES